MENQSNKSEEQKTKENSRSKKYSKRRVLKAFYYVFVVSGLSVSVYLGYKYLENIKEDVSSTQRTVVETKEKVANIEQLSNMNNSRLDVLTSQGSYQNYSMPIPIFANLTV